MADPIVKWPFGDASVVQLSATGAQALSIQNDMTIVDGVTNVATGNRTLNLTVSPDVKAGAIILVKSKTTGTETTVPGTIMSGPTVVGVAGKTMAVTYIYDGAKFTAAGASVQLD